ncbi:hypothetical protein HEK131_59190 [Streptomyces seoulensis]|nr:hypothetical protein HEK131_59190 [Streptomyces seoulensis]
MHAGRNVREIRAVGREFRWNGTTTHSRRARRKRLTRHANLLLQPQRSAPILQVTAPHWEKSGR